MHARSILRRKILVSIQWQWFTHCDFCSGKGQHLVHCNWMQQLATEEVYYWAAACSLQLDAAWWPPFSVDQDPPYLQSKHTLYNVQSWQKYSIDKNTGGKDKDKDMTNFLWWSGQVYKALATHSSVHLSCALCNVILDQKQGRRQTEQKEESAAIAATQLSNDDTLEQVLAVCLPLMCHHFRIILGGVLQPANWVPLQQDCSLLESRWHILLISFECGKSVLFFVLLSHAASDTGASNVLASYFSLHSN